MVSRSTAIVLFLLSMPCCATPEADPIDPSEIPWEELFPPEDVAERAEVDPGELGADVTAWPPEGATLITNSCSAGAPRRVGGTVYYDGPEVPPGASLYLLMDSHPVPPPGIPECFMGATVFEFPAVFEFQEVWDAEPRYVMALLKWDGSFPPVPGPDDWFARAPLDGPLPMDEDVFWLDLELAPYVEE